MNDAATDAGNDAGNNVEDDNRNNAGNNRYCHCRTKCLVSLTCHLSFMLPAAPQLGGPLEL